MANNEEISRLKENEKRLFDRQKRSGNSGEIMKQRNKKGNCKKMHLWLETLNFMCQARMKKIAFSIKWLRQN